MEQVLVSVVMPSYNHREYVGRAIESVLRQTYENFEFIIADDGSTDGSPEVISQYDDPRIKFIKFEQNTSFGACEYIYQQAKGKYIASICSDDMWKETLLEKYVAFLQEHEEYGCCFCKPDIIDENDNIVEDSEYNKIFTSENHTKEQWFRKFYLEGNFICAPSMCLRRSLYEKLGSFRFQFRQLQDYEFWMRLVQISNIYIYPENLIMYRIHQEGDNKNISAPTKEVSIRGRMERKYIMYDIMENVEDKFFIKAFENDFIRKPDAEGFCVECEKFGVMLNTPVVPAHAAIFYYYKHYNESKFRNCLENYYQVSRGEFWNLTGADHDQWYENIKNRNRAAQLSELVNSLKQELAQKDAELNAIKAQKN